MTSDDAVFDSVMRSLREPPPKPSKPRKRKPRDTRAEPTQEHIVVGATAEAAPAPTPEPTPKKKGKPTWRPAQRLDVVNKKPGYVYRWCHNDTANLTRKTSEGWEFVNGSTGLPGDQVRPRDVADGSAISGLESYRELVLMALPEELAEARREYFKGQTDRQAEGIKKSLRRDLDAEARRTRGDTVATYGQVTID